MNREQIEAEFNKLFPTIKGFELVCTVERTVDFAKHIAELEREECAVLCENLVIKFACSSDRTLDQCAGAIRARGNE